MLALILLALLQAEAPHVLHVTATTREGVPAAGETDTAGRATVAATRGSRSYPLDVVLVGPSSIGCVSLNAFPLDGAPLELDVELVPLVEATIATEPPCAACELEVISCGLERGRWFAPARFGLESRATTGGDGRAVYWLPEDSTFSVVCRSIGFERRQVGRTGG